MSNLEAVTKVADQVILRIFDQRQFTSGEIAYLYKEYGERENLEATFDRVLKINESVCKIGDSHDSNALYQSSEATLKSLSQQVDSLLDSSQKILNSEGEFRTRNEPILNEFRREQETRKQKSYSKCNSKLELLKESLLEEQLELERKYLRFEENLRNK